MKKLVLLSVLLVLFFAPTNITAQNLIKMGTASSCENGVKFKAVFDGHVSINAKSRQLVTEREGTPGNWTRGFFGRPGVIFFPPGVNSITFDYCGMNSPVIPSPTQLRMKIGNDGDWIYFTLML